MHVLIVTSRETPWDQLLVDALTRDCGLEPVFFHVAGQRPSPLKQLRDLVDYRLGKMCAPDAPHRVRVSDLDETGASVAIDFTGTFSSPGFGVIRVMCDGIPQDLSFEALANSPEKSTHVLSLTFNGKEVWGAALPPLGEVASLHRANAAKRSIAYIARTLKGKERTNSIATGASQQHSGSSSKQIVRSLALAARRFARRTLGQVPKWQIAYKRGGEPYHIVPSPSGHFFADPFVITREGRTYIFFEAFSEETGRGSISYFEIGDETIHTALSRPYHLSYPFIFDYAGAVYMIPETAANKTIELYRARAFPSQWELQTVLIDQINATDATLHHDENGFWLFASVGEYGSSTWDELHLFHSEQLAGPFVPHPRNPIVIDAARSRPAGVLYQADGRLIRPAQDCSARYGGAIRLQQIDVLSRTEYKEHDFGIISPALFPGALGIHTLSSAGDVTAVDFLR